MLCYLCHGASQLDTCHIYRGTIRSIILEPIDKPDTTCTDQLYWEQVLRSHKLGMSRGLNPRLSYRSPSELVEDLADSIRAQWQADAELDRAGKV